MKKMMLTAILLLAGMGMAASAMAKQVKVILKDGSIVNGDMLGQDSGVLTLETKDGKSKDISLRNIKKIFDADGNAIALDSLSGESSPAPVAKEDAMPSGDDDEAPAPRRHKARTAHASKNGAGKAGAIMTWTGLGVGLVGALVFAYGESEMTAATQHGYTAPAYVGGDYYDYEINGGYYTYADYSRYVSGEAYYWTGGVVTIVGLGVSLTGIIIGAHGHNDQASLLDIQDGKLAWGIPQVDYLPGKTTTTLLTAEF